MKTLRLIYILGGLIALWGIVSCTEELKINAGYRKVSVPISYTLSATSETRATEIKPLNLEKACLFQFTESGDLVMKTDLGKEDTHVLIYVPYSTTTTLKCVLVANASTTDIGEVTTLQSLLDKQLTITDDYIVEDESKMSMSSNLVDVVTGTTSLSFVLKPNLAKIRLTIKGFSSDYYNKLFSVQLRHVHNKVHYALHAHTDAQKAVLHAEGNELIRYQSKVLTSQKFPQTWTWYVPHNALGTTHPKVNDNQHTFIVISAEQREDWKTIRIPVYIAQREDKDVDGKIYEDEIVSYNVEGGNIYDIKIQLNQFNEIEAENETVKLEKYVEFPENTNCHLLNPSTTPPGTVYSIPVIRAWEYWGNRLPADTKWQAEVIWQDMDTRSIDFCDPEGNNVADFDLGQGYDRNDPENSRFFLKLTDQVKFGNIVVGVKALDGPFAGKYIWSWHLWVTNYNPNVAPVPTTEYPEHVFKVRDGHVHRYKDPLDANGNNIAQVFWSDPKNKDIYMMDRNIGAYSADPADNSANNVFRNAGMYYQYGRKDPFPASHTDDGVSNENTTTIYDINGNPKPKFTYFSSVWQQDRMDCVAHVSNRDLGDATATIDHSIHHPDVFISTNIPGWADWVPNNPYYVSNWNHNNTTKRDMNAKSLFDPCPLGWRVHRMGAMMIFSNDFRDANMLNGIYVQGNFNINGIMVTDRYYYHRTINDNDNDPETMTSTNLNIKEEHFIGTGENRIFNGYTFYIADYGKGPTAYYPRTNHRLIVDGFLVKTEDVCNWSIDGGLGDTDPKHVDLIHYGYHLDFYSTNTQGYGYMDMPDSAGKAYGLPVRCIKETVEQSH